MEVDRVFSFFMLKTFLSPNYDTASWWEREGVRGICPVHLHFNPPPSEGGYFLVVFRKEQSDETA
jgi:hypothetical protein